MKSALQPALAGLIIGLIVLASMFVNDAFARWRLSGCQDLCAAQGARVQSFSSTERSFAGTCICTDPCHE